MPRDFLGVGWNWPVATDKSDHIALSRFEENIRQSIILILRTTKGERQMRPELGCDIHTLVFAENNMTTAGLAAFYVEQALGRWEPRIELVSVDATPDPGVRNRLLVQIEYRVIATNTIFNLVYPFYLTEGVGG